MSRRLFICMIFAALLAAGNGFAEVTDNKQVADCYSQASEYAQQKDWRRAIEALIPLRDIASEKESAEKNLAVFYNNWALQIADEGDLDNAQEKLESALSYDAGSRQVKKNLSNILAKKAEREYGKGYAEAGIEIMEKAIEVDPENAAAHLLLGDIYYKQDDFDKASLSWQKAKALDEGLKGLDERFDKLKKEKAVEGDFRERWNLHFKIRFEGARQEEIVYKISDKLMQAYRDVGWYFDYYPEVPITVIIYSSEQFEAVTGRPDFTMGLYDGKVRLRLSDITREEAVLKRIINHEYTHAVIHELFPSGIPRWLHEGIAGWAEDPQYRPNAGERAHLRNLISTGTMKKVYQLEESFSDGAPRDEIATGYLETKLFIQYFMQRYNRFYLKDILSALNQGKDFKEAAEGVLGKDLDKLNTDFLEYLQKIILS